MGMFYGSMTHSYSGKKRKTNAWKKKKTTPRNVVDKSILKVENSRLREIRERRERYPSYVCEVSKNGSTGTREDNSWKLKESKNWTVAPAYNKGAYQVINKSNIKDIGR